MSVVATPAGQTSSVRSRRTRARQTIAMARLELRRGLFSRRSMPLYLLAAAPIGMMLLVALVAYLQHESLSVPKVEMVFAAVYREFVLRWCVFFGVAFVFMNMFRGEILDRSLHYFFLAPLRRELIVVGKYAAGLFTTAFVMGSATAVVYALTFLSTPSAQTWSAVLRGDVVSHGLTYVGITVLACVGYGALFLLIGLLFRNPIVPALVVLVWEYAHFLMPPALKVFSVSYYLDSLLPVPIEDGLVAIVAEPASPPVSVLGLMAFACLMLAVTAWRVRRMEIRYSAD